VTVKVQKAIAEQATLRSSLTIGINDEGCCTHQIRSWLRSILGGHYSYFAI